MEFLVPVHTEDLEVERADRFCIANVLEVDAPGVDADAVLEGATQRAAGPPQRGMVIVSCRDYTYRTVGRTSTIPSLPTGLIQPFPTLC